MKKILCIALFAAMSAIASAAGTVREVPIAITANTSTTIINPTYLGGQVAQIGIGYPLATTGASTASLAVTLPDGVPVYSNANITLTTQCLTLSWPGFEAPGSAIVTFKTNANITTTSLVNLTFIRLD